MPLLVSQKKKLTLLGWGSAFGLTIWVPGGIMPLGGSLTSTSKPASKRKRWFTVQHCKRQPLSIHSKRPLSCQNINQLIFIAAALCYVTWWGLHTLHSLCEKYFRGQTGCSNRRLHLHTYFNAINGDVDCIEAYCSWSPVGAVGSISVGSNQHVLTGPVREMISK